MNTGLDEFSTTSAQQLPDIFTTDVGEAFRSLPQGR